MSLVIVGDVLLDADLTGGSRRLSPEAPVPVVDVDGVRRRAGGAGLVARMLAREGRDIRLVTVLSDDGASAQLREALDGIDVVAGPSGAPTPVKTRIRANGQSVVRFDEGCGPAPVPEATAEMLAAVEAADAILVSDYGRRLTADPRLREALQRRIGRIPVVWDPHPAGSDPLPGTVVTPNLDEALRAADLADGAGTPAAATAAAAGLLARWDCRAAVVTLGAGGALLLETPDGLPQVLPAPPVSVADPCGAGDRFAATLAVQLLDGAALPDAVSRAVADAAAFLAAGGVAAMDGGAALVELHSGAVDAQRLAAQTRAKGGTVVATGGCFDLLHAGHTRTLEAARRLGDCLIVLLNSDDSVRRLKGSSRPIIRQEDRAELLRALKCVDAVLVFGEDTPEAALDQLRPDVWVKGGDYDAGQLPEAKLVAGWGGQTVTVPYYPARSTTSLAAALERVG